MTGFGRPSLDEIYKMDEMFPLPMNLEKPLNMAIYVLGNIARHGCALSEARRERAGYRQTLDYLQREALNTLLVIKNLIDKQENVIEETPHLHETEKIHDVVRVNNESYTDLEQGYYRGFFVGTDEETEGKKIGVDAYWREEEVMLDTALELAERLCERIGHREDERGCLRCGMGINMMNPMSEDEADKLYEKNMYRQAAEQGQE